MEVPLPEAWKESVVRILRAGAVNRDILITLRALQDWEATTMAWPHELVDSLAEYFSRSGVTGQRVEGMADQGETYEFLFSFKGQSLYGKVCLLEGKIKVKIISAHRPLKGLTL